MITIKSKSEIEKMKHRVDVLPARIHIVSDDPDGLKGIDQAKVGKVRMNTYPILKPYIDKIDGMYPLSTDVFIKPLILFTNSCGIGSPVK